MKVNIATPKSQTNIKDAVVHKAKFSNMAVIVDLLRKHYAFPIRTLVQEYLCNARDSHREAKKTKTAIDVFLPTKNSPMFKIRDFGVGMSEERLVENFISYGGSTKSSSDLQTGGFGIGSKSAFIYTNTFFVRSVIDGVERLYEVSIATHYEGAMRLLSEKKTTEATGVEVMIPVEKKDLEEFIMAFYRCTYFWTAQPINVVNFKPEELAQEYVNRNIVETDEYYFHNHEAEFFKEINYSNDSIVLDGIIYSVANSVPSKRDWEIQSFVMIPKFKTGDFKVSISREAIEDSDAVRKKLNKFFCDEDKIVKNTINAMAVVASFAPKFKDYNEILSWHKELNNKYEWLSKETINYALSNDLFSFNIDSMELKPVNIANCKNMAIIGRFGLGCVAIEAVEALSFHGFYKNKNNRLSFNVEGNVRSLQTLRTPLFLINDLSLSGGKIEVLIKDYNLEGKYDSIVVVNNYTHPKVKDYLVKLNAEKISNLTKEKSEELEKNKLEAKAKREAQRKINAESRQENAEHKRIKKMSTYDVSLVKGKFKVELSCYPGLNSCEQVVLSKDDKSSYFLSELKDSFFNSDIVWVSQEDLEFLKKTDKVKIKTIDQFLKTSEYKKGVQQVLVEYSAWIACENKSYFSFIMGLVSKDEDYNQVISRDKFDNVARILQQLNLKVDKKTQSMVKKIESHSFIAYLSQMSLTTKVINDLRKKMKL